MILYLVIIIAGLALINFIVTRILRKSKEDYESMILNSEKYDAEDRKKNDYVFFPKDM